MKRKGLKVRFEAVDKNVKHSERESFSYFDAERDKTVDSHADIFLLSTETPSNESFSSREVVEHNEIHSGTNLDSTGSIPAKGKQGRPQKSYHELIKEAIENSSEQRLILSEIYAYISENYPFFKISEKGWKNSVRHNLSLNRSFSKVPRKIGFNSEGSLNSKGSFWQITPIQERNSSKRSLISLDAFAFNGGLGNGYKRLAPNDNSRPIIPIHPTPTANIQSRNLKNRGNRSDQGYFESHNQNATHVHKNNQNLFQPINAFGGTNEYHHTSPRCFPDDYNFPDKSFSPSDTFSFIPPPSGDRFDADTFDFKRDLDDVWLGAKSPLMSDRELFELDAMRNSPANNRK